MDRHGLNRGIGLIRISLEAGRIAAKWSRNLSLAVQTPNLAFLSGKIVGLPELPKSTPAEG